MVLCLSYVGFQWIRQCPPWWNFQLHQQGSSLCILPDFQVSQTLVLTDCYLLNHWWISIIRAMGPNIFTWLRKLEEQSYIYLNMFLKVINIWFVKSPRKPPDKVQAQLQTSYFTVIYNTVMHIIAHTLFIYEDLLYHFFNINIDLNH